MIQATILKGLSKAYRAIAKPQFVGNPWPRDDEWTATNDYISGLLVQDKPCLLGRIGTVECAVVANYITVHGKKCYARKCVDYISDDTRLPLGDTGKPFVQLQNNAGFLWKLK